MRFHTGMMAVAAFLAVGVAERAGAEEASYTLREEHAQGSLQRVQVEIKTEGKLKLNASGKQVTQLPIEVAATLAYDERALAPAAKESLRRVRFYQEAKADIRVGTQKQTSELREESRLVMLQTQGDDLALYAPQAPLSREELELIDVPANSAVLSGLLAARAVKIGESWQPSNETFAQLLNIDVVLKNEAQATLKSVDENEAKLELKGKVDGSVSGISTHFELTAKFTFDRMQKQITWFAISLKEERAIGHAEPGYDVTSQVKVLLAPLAASADLTDKIVATLPAEPNAGQTLMRLESEAAGFRLFHDRRWRTMVDRPDLVVLRYVDRGDLVAQCNISKLSRLPANKFLSLESFQKDVTRALDKSVEQFIDGAASTTSNGVHILRVSAVGKVAELPIHWVYFHVTAEDGRCFSCVFTLEQKLVERFGGADQSLMETFEFLTDTKAEEKKAESGPELPAAGKKADSERR